MMPAETSSLTVDVRPGEGLTLSSGVAIELIKKSGRLARLRITASRDAKIDKLNKECKDLLSPKSSV